jgi:hypothetical protein
MITIGLLQRDGCNALPDCSNSRGRHHHGAENKRESLPFPKNSSTTLMNTDKRDTVRPIPPSPLRGPGSGKQLVDAKHWLEKFLRGKRVDEKHPRYSSLPECNSN